MSYSKLDVSSSIWENFFSVFPLVIVGSREPDGSYDLAPKHLAIPASWQNHYAFVCAPHHHTYINIRQHEQFTVSYPKPDQILMTSLAADPRAQDDSKPALKALPQLRANTVDGVFVENSYLFLECKLETIVDDLGVNSLIIGEIIDAQIDDDYLRQSELDDQQLIHSSPLLAYLYPGRFAKIDQSYSFPFPKGFKR